MPRSPDRRSRTGPRKFAPPTIDPLRARLASFDNRYIPPHAVESTRIRLIPAHPWHTRGGFVHPDALGDSVAMARPYPEGLQRQLVKVLRSADPGSGNRCACKVGFEAHLNEN